MNGLKSVANFIGNISRFKLIFIVANLAVGMANAEAFVNAQTET